MRDNKEQHNCGIYQYIDWNIVSLELTDEYSIQIQFIKFFHKKSHLIDPNQNISMFISHMCGINFFNVCCF